MATTKVNHPDLLDLASDTGATVFPKGTTAERPVSPEAGYIRFNTTDNVMETYDGTEWLVLDTLIPPYAVDYLVVAGGGGGGFNNGGGGGAGGYRNSYNNETSGGNSPSESPMLVNIGELYNIIIGAGGAAGTDPPNAGYTGENSSFSTIVSLGGGGGAYVPQDGGSGGGGSGAGTSTQYPGGLGTSGQGFSGGYGGFRYAGGGGGGAGAPGENIPSSQNPPLGGNGGIGLQSSITGTSIYRAGGGGGATQSGASYGNGGLGGGGRSQIFGGSQATAGTSNTGGGGGGNYTYTGGGNQGGSGVVILRMPTAKYSGTTTGSPTVTTDGSDTILTYTSSGTYTA